jgi:twinkle protein
MVICDKQRNGEWEGRIGLWYLPAAMQFVEDGISGPMGLLAV